MEHDRWALSASRRPEGGPQVAGDATLFGKPQVDAVGRQPPAPVPVTVVTGRTPPLSFSGRVVEVHASDFPPLSSAMASVPNGNTFTRSAWGYPEDDPGEFTGVLSRHQSGRRGEKQVRDKVGLTEKW